MDDQLREELEALVWAWARRQGHMDAETPHEVGLTHERRRQAWLATLAGLTAVQESAAELSRTAATRAVEYGADYPDLGRATGMTRQGARRRWPGLAGLNRLTGRGRTAPMKDDAWAEFVVKDPLSADLWKQ